MGWFHTLQLALPSAAAFVLATRLRVHYFREGLHGATYCAALHEVAVHAGAAPTVEFVERLPRTPLTVLTREVLGQPPQELLDAPAEAATDSLMTASAALHGMGRMALPLAFLGTILQLSAAFRGGEGLVALQKGLAEHIALQAALLSFAIGAGTSLFCLTGASLLRRHAREQIATVSSVRRVGMALDGQSSGPPPSSDGIVPASGLPT